MMGVPSIAAGGVSIKQSGSASVNKPYAQSIDVVQCVLIRVIRCCV